ncbi:hypothetical protein Tco_0862326 [Tanacetum coccineum]
MILIHRLEDQVIIGETSLAFSLEVAHNRVQRLTGDATARRLSLTDSILPLVEPLSARNLTGEASSSADLTTAVTTALSTTLVQTDPDPMVLSTEVPPSPKIFFEEEELDTTPSVANVPCLCEGISVAVSKLVCSSSQCFRDFIWSLPLRSKLAYIFYTACLIAPVDEISRTEACSAEPCIIVFFHLGYAFLLPELLPAPFYLLEDPGSLLPSHRPLACGCLMEVKH